MTVVCHKDEMLFLSLVFLAFDGICIFFFLFSIVMSIVTRNIGDAISSYTFSPLYKGASDALSY